MTFCLLRSGTCFVGTTCRATVCVCTGVRGRSGSQRARSEELYILNGRARARSLRMTPSELNWMQGSVFYILGTLTPGIFWLARRYRTKHGTREVDLEGIQIGTDTSTDTFEGEPPSELSAPLRGGGDEGRSPSNHAPEAILFTALPWRSHERKPCSPGRKRLRSNFRTSKPPSMKKSQGMDVVPQTEPRILRSERGNDVVADPPTPWMSSTTAALSRPPRRRFVPRFSTHDEGIPQVDDIQAETSQGLRHRLRASFHVPSLGGGIGNQGPAAVKHAQVIEPEFSFPFLRAEGGGTGLGHVSIGAWQAWTSSSCKS